ncbi:GNAT family N-acetyltransferase [Algoriphagus sp. A40]|uniref:GNAT family N-acetyltransferase n=1 Tax=Algoriphagus sp. A40 TaxID=1945863 RepID=UPI001C2BACC1|nr:GNAT family N-acetyltransferase [Algoriphagus sp. A40]
MKIEDQEISFKRLEKGEKMPFDLLLLADPSLDLIAEYLEKSEVFAAVFREEIIGEIVVFQSNPETVEIKNVAVKPDFQGKGIGSFLLEQAIQIARNGKNKLISIGTANSGVSSSISIRSLDLSWLK